MLIWKDQKVIRHLERDVITCEEEGSFENGRKMGFGSKNFERDSELQGGVGNMQKVRPSPYHWHVDVW